MMLAELSAAGRENTRDLAEVRQVRHLIANGVAKPGSAAANRMDLLTVVLHEMGHFDGWTELDPATHPDALMALTLGTGHAAPRTSMPSSRQGCDRPGSLAARCEDK